MRRAAYAESFTSTDRSIVSSPQLEEDGSEGVPRGTVENRIRHITGEGKTSRTGSSFDFSGRDRENEQVG